MQRLTNNLNYPILIGEKLNFSDLIKDIAIGQKLMLVVDATTDKLFAKQFLDAIKTSFVQANKVVIKQGEINKNWQNLQLIIDSLVANNHDRNTTIIALGGGIVGDIAGFAASCFLRGVRLIQIPTTLLSQVDSSVGGKTGINHTQGKNLIGSFYQPQAVFIDIDFLKHLPKRQLSAGLAEVLKYGLIADKTFYDWLVANSDKLINCETDAIIYAIKKSCQTKANIVAADTYEQSSRALLNFGHTFGHAIETATGYKQYLHGEAVAIGMLMAIAASKILYAAEISPQADEQLQQLYKKWQLPTKCNAKLTVADYLKYFKNDKKVIDNNSRFILLKTIGQAYIETIDIRQNSFKTIIRQWI